MFGDLEEERHADRDIEWKGDRERGRERVGRVRFRQRKAHRRWCGNVTGARGKYTKQCGASDA